MRPFRFSVNETDEIVKLAKQGTRLSCICEKFGGVHHSFIQGVLKRNGIVGPPRMLLTGNALKEAISMYKVGSSNKVAEVLGMSSRTILDALHRAEISIRPRRKFDNVTERMICSEYLDSKSSTQLSKYYGCSNGLILDILRRGNVLIRPKRKLNFQIVSQLPQRYRESSMSRAELGMLYGVCAATIGNRLHEENVEMRDSRDESRRTYRIDQLAFSLETEESLYWIGFLMADGCVDEHGTLSIHLQYADRGHLYKLRSFLNSSAPVRQQYGNESGYRPGVPFASFCIHCTTIVEQLIAYGVIPRKTGRECLLKGQSSRHVWRGLVDGDGTVGFHKRGYFYLKLYGSHAICSQFRAFVLTLVPTCKATVRKSRTIYSFGVSCGVARIVAVELYRNNNVALSRKAKIVRQLSAREIADR